MRGLVIKAPWIDFILEGRKTWEIRSTATKVRERIALIRGGSGLVVGTADLVDSIGPMTADELTKHEDKHCVRPAILAEFLQRYKGKAHAWVLRDVTPLQPPVRYQHPSGAVIWVTLPDAWDRESAPSDQPKR